MEITIFNGVTTESALAELEAEGKKYEGLYVDMENAPERKYVKDKASLIAGIKKKVDRVRIDAAKNYKLEVEKQAAYINSRLDDANAPFQVLIDDYAVERKKVLDAEKARKQAIIDAEQYELDHEMALLINKTFEYDREQELKAKQEHEKQIAEQAAINALLEKQREDERLEREKINAENARLANVEHVRKINTDILFVLVTNGISEDDAKTMIRLAAKNELPQLKINY